MDCQHASSDPNEAHVLPCRHKICLSCVREIKGLLTGKVFSCPKCGNCSQYVKPEEEVYGKQSRYAGDVFGIDDPTTEAEVRANFIESGGSREGYGCQDEQPRRTTDQYNGSNSPMECDYASRHRASSKIYNTPEFTQSSSRPRSPSSVWGSSQPPLWPQRSNPFEITGAATADLPVNSGYGSAYSSDVSTHVSEEKVNQPEWLDGKAHSNCFFHNKPVYYFCKNCNFPVCAACKNLVEHKSHQIFDMEKGEEESGDAQHLENEQLEGMCGKHNKPFLTVCSEKQEFLCVDCLSWRLHSCGRSYMHTRVEKCEDFLRSRVKVFQEKLAKLSESEEHNATRRAVNLTNLLEETEKLEKQVNDATEEAKRQLEENRVAMIGYIKKVSEEKVNSVGTSAEVSNISGFLQEANRMSENTQQFIRKGQYQEAFRSHWQMVETVNTITAEVKKKTVKEEILGLRVVAKRISANCMPYYADALIHVERK